MMAVYAMDEMGEEDLCLFCRTLQTDSEEETVKRVKKLVGKDNGDACCMLAGSYAQGMTVCHKIGEKPMTCG